MTTKGRIGSQSLTWTRHTSYPNIHADRIKIPAEISSVANVFNKNAEQEISNRRTLLTKLQRKNVRHLESRRKLMNESMIVYTETMHSLTNSRNRNLNSTSSAQDKKIHEFKWATSLNYSRRPAASTQLPEIKGIQRQLDSKPGNKQKGYAEKTNPTPDCHQTKTAEDSTLCSNNNAHKVGPVDNVRNIVVNKRDKSNVSVYLAELRMILSQCRCSNDKCKLDCKTGNSRYKPSKASVRSTISVSLPPISSTS